MITLTLRVKSFIEEVEEVFGTPDVTVLLSNTPCQDPLEKHFRKQHQLGKLNYFFNIPDNTTGKV